MLNIRAIAIISIALSISACDAPEAKSSEAIAKINVEQTLEGMTKSYERCNKAHERVCDFIFDSAKGVQVSNITVKKLENQVAACGEIAGTSLSGKPITDKFVMPIVSETESNALYFKMPGFEKDTPATQMFDIAESKFCN